MYYPLQFLKNFIFEMPDDALYPHCAQTFLSTGSFCYVGGKPFVALLMAMTGCTTLWSSIIFYFCFGLVTIVALYLVSTEFIGQKKLQWVPAALWASSLFFAYYSKTHLTVFIAFYLLGLWAVIRGFLVGWALLGCSMLSYYLGVIYVPCIALYFLRRDGFRLIFPLAAPIILYDCAVVGARIIWGIKNTPFVLSTFYQLTGVTKATGNYPFRYYPHLFASHENIAITVLVVLGLMYVTYRRELLLILLCVPGLFLIVRGMQGHLTVARTFVGILPILYLLCGHVLDKIVHPRMSTICAVLVAFLVGVRFYEQYVYAHQLNTGYAQVAEFLQKHDGPVIYLGRPHTWELLLRSKEIIALNQGNDPLNGMKSIAWQKRLSGKQPLLVISCCDQEKWHAVTSYFSNMFTLRLLCRQPSPHRRADLVLEEDNYKGVNHIALLRDQAVPRIDVFTMTPPQ